MQVWPATRPGGLTGLRADGFAPAGNGASLYLLHEAKRAGNGQAAAMSGDEQGPAQPAEGAGQPAGADAVSAQPVSPAADSTPSAGRGALILMGGTLASRITGLLRNSLLTQLYASGVSDAFVTAFRVPNLFRELLAEGALTNSFVPVYSRLGREEGARLAGALLGALLVVNGLLLLGGWFAAPWLAGLLIGDPTLVDVGLTTELIRIVFPFLLTISLSALAMGVLNANERFLAPAWAPVALNVVTIAFMAVFPGLAVPLALSHVLGGLAQVLVQLPALVRHGLLPAGLRLWHPALGSVLLLMIPFAVTSSGRQILNLVASNVITGIAAGAQTAFYNADLFLSLALGLFSISPALSWYSRLSRLAVDDPGAFGPTLARGLGLIAFLTVPAGLAMYLFAAPAVEIVFNWRALVGQPLTDGRLELTVAAMAPLGLAVFPIGLSNLLVRTFYIRRRVIPPVIVTLCVLALQGGLYVVMARAYGLPGVSWAIVAASTVQLVVLLALVERAEQFGLAALAGHCARVFAAAAGAGLAVLGYAWLLPLPAGWWGQFGWLAAGMVLFGGAYVVLALLLGVPGLAGLRGRLARRGSGRRAG